MKMFKRSLATTVREDKNLFKMLSQVPEDNVCKEHMVLEKGTDTYANTRQNLCRKINYERPLSYFKRKPEDEELDKTFSSEKAEVARLPSKPCLEHLVLTSSSPN